MIQDQYTHRTDLTPSQKFRLRHPDYIIKQRGYQAEWRSKHPGHHAAQQYAYALQHPDRAEESQKKYLLKKKLIKVAARTSNAKKFILKGNSRLGLGKRREILNLHNRGRDVGRIAVWMNLPVSVVNAVIDSTSTPSNILA